MSSELLAEHHMGYESYYITAQTSRKTPEEKPRYYICMHDLATDGRLKRRVDAGDMTKALESGAYCEKLMEDLR